MFKVMRQFEASFAHTLKDHKGKCKRLHGHNYMIELEFSSPFLGEANYPNMLMDFGDIKDIYKEHIEDLYDHRQSHAAVCGRVCLWTCRQILTACFQ